MKIALLGWLIGLAGILLQGLNAPKESKEVTIRRAEPVASTDAVPEHRAVALRR